MTEYICKEVQTDNGGYLEPVNELIRCKDCKEYAEWGDSMICMRLGSYYGDTKPNDFCSRAERKE